MKGHPCRFLPGHQSKAANRLRAGSHRWKIEERDGCHLWLGSLNSKGYALVGHNSTVQLVHRFVYEGIHGPLAAGYQIHHQCENRRCVNPAHLEAVTPLEHSARHHRLAIGSVSTMPLPGDGRSRTGGAVPSRSRSGGEA